MSVCKCILALLFLWTSDEVVAAQEQQQSFFTTETKSITVPFEWHRGHLLLKVEVNGEELRLTLDNGVLWEALLLYGGPKVDSLGLELDTMGEASGLTVRLPGLELRNQAAVVTPASAGFAESFRGEDGSISGTLFNRFVVRIDFEKNELTLSDPKTFEYQGHGEKFELTLFEPAAHTLPGTLHMGDDKTFVVNPVLDLGGLQPLLFFRGTREDLPLPEGAQPEELGVGWSGHLGTVPELRLGKFTLKNVPTGYTEAVGKLGPRCEGLLGPGVFARFHVTFDYSRRWMFLEPNRHFDAPFRKRFPGWEAAGDGTDRNAGIHDVLPQLEGDYLGQPRPGVVPEPFASFVVAERHHKHCHPAFSPAGGEYWFWLYLNDEYPKKIYFMKRQGERWTAPQLAPFSGAFQEGGPVFSADGNKLFFYSKRPRTGSGEAREDNDIWYVERTADGWSEPVNPGPPLNTSRGEYPGKLDAGGTFHFTVKIEGNYDLFRATYRDGVFSDVRTLGPPINTPGSLESDPQTALDGSYLLFTSFRRTGKDDIGIYVSFKDDDGSWSPPKSMGDSINEGGARFPGLSSDGTLLFFTSLRSGEEEFYWVDATIIDDLRVKTPNVKEDTN
jgi:hypothetical protein